MYSRLLRAYELTLGQTRRKRVYIIDAGLITHTRSLCKYRTYYTRDKRSRTWSIHLVERRECLHYGNPAAAANRSVQTSVDRTFEYYVIVARTVLAVRYLSVIVPIDLRYFRSVVFRVSRRRRPLRFETQPRATD